MREPNPPLAPVRQRPEALLPQIAALALPGQTTRQIATEVDLSKSTVIRWPKSLRRDCPTRAVAQSPCKSSTN